MRFETSQTAYSVYSEGYKDSFPGDSACQGPLLETSFNALTDQMRYFAVLRPSSYEFGPELTTAYGEAFLEHQSTLTEALQTPELQTEAVDLLRYLAIDAGTSLLTGALESPASKAGSVIRGHARDYFFAHFEDLAKMYDAPEDLSQKTPLQIALETLFEESFLLRTERRRNDHVSTYIALNEQHFRRSGSTTATTRLGSIAGIASAQEQAHIAQLLEERHALSACQDSDLASLHYGRWLNPMEPGLRRMARILAKTYSR